jgi:hypothetical protein
MGFGLSGGGGGSEVLFEGEIPPVTEPKQNIPEQTNTPASGEVAGGMIVVAGDIDDPGGVGRIGTDTVRYYSPDSDSWSLLQNYPMAVTGLEGTGYGDGKFLAVGGENESGDFVSDCYSYDYPSDSWQQVSSLPQALNNPSVAEMGGDVYVLGGIDSDSNPLDSVYRYNPDSDSWSAEISMPTPRYAAAGQTFNGEIHVHGGLQGISSPLSVHEAYNGNSWRVVGTDTRRYHHKAGISDGKLVLGPGRNSASVIGQSLQLLVDGSFQSMPNVSLQDKGAGAVIGDSSFFSAGENKTNTVKVSGWVTVATAPRDGYAVPAGENDAVRNLTKGLGSSFVPAKWVDEGDEVAGQAGGSEVRFMLI